MAAQFIMPGMTSSNTMGIGGGGNNSEDVAAGAEKAPKKKRYDFDATSGLRGICCLLVIAGNFSHFFSSIPSDPEAYSHYTFDYHTPVTLFFVMSGVLLASLYGDKLSNGPCTCWSAPANRTFWRKRAARLTPLYYLALLVYTPAWFLAPAAFGDKSDAGESDSESDVAASGANNGRWAVPLASLTMTRSFFPLGFVFSEAVGIGQVTYVASLWTISAFMLCYAFTPCLLACCKSGEQPDDSAFCKGPCRSQVQKAWLVFGWLFISLLAYLDVAEEIGLLHLSGVARCLGPFAAGLWTGARLPLLSAHFEAKGAGAAKAATTMLEITTTLVVFCWVGMLGVNFLGRAERITMEVSLPLPRLSSACYGTQTPCILTLSPGLIRYLKKRPLLVC